MATFVSDVKSTAMPKKHEATTESEFAFYEKIKGNLKVIFDVGSSNQTEFLDFPGEVHYFDPLPQYLARIPLDSIKNSKFFLNGFGLSDKNEHLYYYPHFASFFDRIKSCGKSDDANKIMLEVKKSKDYLVEKNIQQIDFLKIDTEGYEFKVLKGFEEMLRCVKIIQFEYGGTFIDNETKLIEVIDYLKSMGFCRFSLLTDSGPVEMTDYSDNYEYCNIVCVNETSDYNPFI